MSEKKDRTNDFSDSPLISISNEIARIDERVHSIQNDVTELQKKSESHDERISKVEERSKDNKQYIERVRSSIKNGLINFLLPVIIAVISWILQKF